MLVAYPVRMNECAAAPEGNVVLLLVVVVMNSHSARKDPGQGAVITTMTHAAPLYLVFHGVRVTRRGSKLSHVFRVPPHNKTKGSQLSFSCLSPLPRGHDPTPRTVQTHGTLPTQYVYRMECAICMLRTSISFPSTEKKCAKKAANIHQIYCLLIDV